MFDLPGQNDIEEVIIDTGAIKELLNLLLYILKPKQSLKRQVLRRF